MITLIDYDYNVGCVEAQEIATGWVYHAETAEVKDARCALL